MRAVGKCFGWWLRYEKKIWLNFDHGKLYSHWLICLGFRLARAVLPRSGGDALGMVSGKEARAEGSSSNIPSSVPVLLLLLLRGVNHLVFVFFVMRMVRLGLTV
jgi:hypothetical protein